MNVQTADDWATYTLKEAPFWREGISPEEYEIEREYLGRNYDLLMKNQYVPLWKQSKLGNDGKMQI